MAWFDRWHRPAETGDEQLARLARVTPERPVPARPSADLPTRLARLRQILDLVSHYVPGTTYSSIAEARGTPEHPLTARRVGLLHQAGPADLADVTGAELAQISAIALRRPERLATDPEAVAQAAAHRDLWHALDACRRHLGALPALRSDPDLATAVGHHAYATALRRQVARRRPDARREPYWLTWGRRGEGRPGRPILPAPRPREAVITAVALIIALLRTEEGRHIALDEAGPRPGTTAWARATNATTGWAYHMRGRGGSVHRPAYLSDRELEQALRQADGRGSGLLGPVSRPGYNPS